MNNGSHLQRGYADGLTFDSLGNDRMTGGGASETFVFDPGFGADVVTDFAQHLSGAGADTISVSTSQFADFAALLAATRKSGANVVITAPNHDTITLLDMTRSLVASHVGDFAFHA
jgi:Ca2+-binding RTX toxin-like protein